MTYVVKAKRAVQLMSMNNQVLMADEELETEELTDELKRAERAGSISITEIETITVTTELPPEKETVEVPTEIPKETDEPESEPEEESPEEEAEEEPEEE